jgi:hypothetical protein
MNKGQFFCSLLGALSSLSFANEWQVSGYVESQIHVFPNSPTQSAQFESTDLSLAAQPQWTWSNEDQDTLIRITPFMRIDQRDSERSHFDMREMYIHNIHSDWELKAGIAKVFWGVTEFQHLVDVINQTDLIEDIDGEEKLGQPMINVTWVQEYGLLDFYLLPYFRQPTFAGTEGRLRTPIIIDHKNATFDASNEEHHLDGAIRWSTVMDQWDIGTHVFYGTERTPELRFNPQHPTRLYPHYANMFQLGLDAQWTGESWLHKAEVIWRNDGRSPYWAVQLGTEYTVYDVKMSGHDIGFLAEYGGDTLSKNDTARLFQNDLSLGVRWTLNDIVGSQLLAGFTYDLDYADRSFFIEASRRLNDQWKLILEARLFDADNDRSALYIAEKDSHLLLTLQFYF